MKTIAMTTFSYADELLVGYYDNGGVRRQRCHGDVEMSVGYYDNSWPPSRGHGILDSTL